MEATRILLEHGAKTEARNKDGHTPLHVAVSSHEGSIETVFLLLEHGADLHAKCTSTARRIDKGESGSESSTGRGSNVSNVSNGSSRDTTKRRDTKRTGGTTTTTTVAMTPLDLAAEQDDSTLLTALHMHEILGMTKHKMQRKIDRVKDLRAEAKVHLKEQNSKTDTLQRTLVEYTKREHDSREKIAELEVKAAYVVILQDEARHHKQQMQQRDARIQELQDAIAVLEASMTENTTVAERTRQLKQQDEAQKREIAKLQRKLQRVTVLEGQLAEKEEQEQARKREMEQLQQQVEKLGILEMAVKCQRLRNTLDHGKVVKLERRASQVDELQQLLVHYKQRDAQQQAEIRNLHQKLECLEQLRTNFQKLKGVLPAGLHVG